MASREEIQAGTIMSGQSVRQERENVTNLSINHWVAGGVLLGPRTALQRLRKYAEFSGIH